MRAGLLGMINTPAQGSVLLGGVPWCADNGCFGKGYPGDDAFLRWLARLAPHAGRCAFATAPDVVADAEATLRRSAPFLPVIRGLGYPVALVAQDGIEHLDPPWDEFDVLFLGGSTGWKLGPHARRVAAEAKARGKRVHGGRGNTRQRLRYFHDIGCDSADGTTLARGADRNLPPLLAWLRELNHQDTLWAGGAA